MDLMPEILVSTVTTFSYNNPNNPNNPRVWQFESFVFNDSSCDKLKGVIIII